jgi:hypothetical protein
MGQFLLALGSMVLLRGSGCVVVYCSETCDPCVTQCQCHTCPHAAVLDFEPAHRLVAFELIQSANEQRSTRQTLAWIDGLSIARATGRQEFAARDLREFAEGVLGVNSGLLDLPAALGRWEFVAVDLAAEFGLVTFTRKDAQGRAAEGLLEFLFDARGKLVEIDRTLPQS